ncbi:MAG: PE-PGRS family protein [Polyangiales bacterium]
MAFTLLFTTFTAASADAQRRVDVSDAASLRAAIEGAMPGDDIVLATGDYEVEGNLRTRVAGTNELPVRVRSEELHGAHLRFGADGGLVEGFIPGHAFWTFDGLRLEGVCADHSRCEHAWHIVNDADNVVIQNCDAFNFNAHIKGNGGGDSTTYPDDVLVVGNHFYNTAPRQTSNPVTPIDVVGGRRWIVRANHIHDFEKAQGNNISYAAFFKGASRDGIFERNLIVCSQEFSGGVRVGLSFGGGGTGPDPVCEGGDCSIEHTGGIMRNNIILHCSDVGIYVNECADCVVAHNTLFDTSGIDFRFGVTSVSAVGNLHSGNMRNRDGATSDQVGNLQIADAEFESYFRDPGAADFGLVDGSAFVDMGEALESVSDDYCGNLRSGMYDLGAVEFDGDGPCDTTRTHPLAAPAPGDDAGPGSDAGPGADAGPGPDAGPGFDGGAGADAGPGADGGPGVDAGGDLGDEGGCGCSLAGVGASRPSLALWALLGLVAFRRRRGH